MLTPNAKFERLCHIDRMGDISLFYDIFEIL